MKAKLTKEEKEILDSFEKGEWVPVADLPKRRKTLARYARNTFTKDKQLNKETSLSYKDWPSKKVCRIRLISQVLFTSSLTEHWLIDVHKNYRPQHFLNFFPLPQGHGSLRRIRSPSVAKAIPFALA